jgi:putative tryptophan/tyrosine transport system substrate-binding protein
MLALSLGEHMRRRKFISLLSGAAAWPLAARAQQRERMRRIAILMPYPKGDIEFEERVQELRRELQRLGWEEGINVRFDERWTTDNMDAVRSSAASLVEWNPDAIVASGGRVVPILMQLTRSIPIIVPTAFDPVGTGWVKSLARPDGNVTGFTVFELSITGKMLEILMQIAPTIARVALVYNPDNPNSRLYREWFEKSASPLGIEPIVFPIHGLSDIDRAVLSFPNQQNAGIFFAPDITINSLRDQVIALVARQHLPAIYSEAFFVKGGGLAFYGADRGDLYIRAAGYIDRILRGEKPSDLPFQQATKFQLVINLKTAKALGLELSPAVLALADEVI